MSAEGQAAPAPEPRFSADQAARALQRAVALGAERLETDAADMSMAELVELGKEIGLSEADVRAAAAMERYTAGADDASRLDRWAGPVRVSEQDVINVPPEQAAKLVEEWVRVAHCMRVHRRDGDTTVWEPAAGLAGSLMRGARSLAGEKPLTGVRGMTTSVVAVGDGRTAVRAEIDPGPRLPYVAGAAGTLGGALAAAPIMALLIHPVFLVLAPVGIAIAASVLYSRTAKTKAARREIERLMSGVAHGDRPPGTLEAVRGMVRKPR